MKPGARVSISNHSQLPKIKQMHISNVGSLIEPSPGLALFTGTLFLFSPTPDKFQHQIRPAPRLHRSELSYPRPPPPPPAVTRLRVTPREENNSLRKKLTFSKTRQSGAVGSETEREREGREGVLLLRLRYDSGGGGGVGEIGGTCECINCGAEGASSRRGDVGDNTWGRKGK